MKNDLNSNGSGSPVRPRRNIQDVIDDAVLTPTYLSFNQAFPEKLPDTLSEGSDKFENTMNQDSSDYLGSELSIKLRND